MRRCPRCGHWHGGHDSETCDRCWEELGQMQFEYEEDPDRTPPPLLDSEAVE
jgi:hypothetical protein